VRCEKILIQNLARLSTKKDEHMVYNIRSYFALNLILMWVVIILLAKMAS